MTREEFETAKAALRRRSPEELAIFADSLLLETATGAGDYARAFAAEESAVAARLIAESIGRWRHWFKHDTYHQADAGAQRLEWTLDAIDRFVRPQDPDAAMDLLVLFFEGDDETGTDDMEAISGAFERAARLFAEVANECPPERGKVAFARLMAREDYRGYRVFLRESVDSKVTGPAR